MLTRLQLHYGLQTFDVDACKFSGGSFFKAHSHWSKATSLQTGSKEIQFAVYIKQRQRLKTNFSFAWCDRTPRIKIASISRFFWGDGGVAIFRIVPSPSRGFKFPTQWILDPPLRMLTTLNRRSFKIRVRSIEYHWINNQILNVLILLKLFSACLYSEFFLRTL